MVLQFFCLDKGIGMVWNISNATTVELNNMTLSVSSIRATRIVSGSAITTNVGITALGANAPGGLLSLSIGGWIPVTLSNGSTAYIPCWV